jgi:hypothetical protein
MTDTDLNLILFYVDRVGIFLGHSILLLYAIAFLRLRFTSAAWKRAWYGILVMSLYIMIGNLSILVDPLIPSIPLDDIFLSPFMRRVRAWMGLLALVGLSIELGRIFLRWPRRP